MKVTDEMRDRMVTSVFVFGKRKSAVAKELGASVASVYSTCSLFDCIKERDWEGARNLCLSRSIGMNAVRWAVSALDANPPTGWVQQLDEDIARQNAEDKASRRKPTCEEPKSETPKEEPKAETPKPIAPEQTPTGAKTFIPAPTAEVGWQTRIKTNPGRVCMTVYFNGVPVVDGYSRIKSNTELDLMQAISYAAHMCYKITEQKKLKG